MSSSIRYVHTLPAYESLRSENALPCCETYLFLKPLLPQNVAFYRNLEETVFLWIRWREKDSGKNVHRIHLQPNIELQIIVGLTV